MSETDRLRKNTRAKRWTRREARDAVERWRGSGQSAAAFAAQHDVSASRLSYWSKQLTLQAEPSAQFVAVALPAQPSAAATVEIVMGGLMLRVAEGADTRFIAQLVSALRGTQPC